MERTSLYPGQRVAVERQPNGAWLVGRADAYGHIADRNETILLHIGELAESSYDQPEARAQCLRDLAERQAERGYLLAWLADEVDAVIEHFHGAVPLEVATPDQIIAIIKQASLCRGWLDYWQGSGQTGETASPGVMLLWRRYCRALTVLYELEPASPALDDAAWRALASWHDLEAEYRRSLRNWSRIVMDPLSEGFIADNLAHGINADRMPAEPEAIASVWEREVNELLWRPDGGLRRFFREQPAGRRFLDRAARRWFLPRYRLDDVARIVKEGLPRQGLVAMLRSMYDPRVLMPWLWVGLIALLLLVGIFAGGVGHGWLLHLWGGLLVTTAGCMMLAMLAASLWAAWRLGRLALYPFSLRLAAGTFVGLVALSGVNEQFAVFTFNAFCQRQSYSLTGTLLLLALSLGAALAYTFTNALNRIGDRRLALRRAAGFWLFGWAQATIFASAASWVAAGRLAPICAEKPCVLPCHGMAFLGGAIYFDYVLIGGILAFVVGVFTQILWDEHPIPEPL